MVYLISELAKQVGLSRSTLLYYEKLNLIQSQRQANGYRIYSEQDRQRIHLLQKLQAGGLTLKECQACLQAKIDSSLLSKRLEILEKEIIQKQQAKELLQAMLGQGDLKAWHTNIDKNAPKAHFEWLKTQGFTEKEALRLRWISKDMNEHEQYMADFMKVFETLERWGPGSEEETLKAVKLLTFKPTHILEIGCGKGLSTEILAQHTQASITAVDNEQSALDRLAERLQSKAYAKRINPVCASMTELPFQDSQFDLIWAEGCAYIMGVENALKQWKPLLQEQGILMLSDLVLLTDSPTPECMDFWKQEYPDIQTIETRTKQIQQAGYEIVEHFTFNQQAWHNYSQPIRQRLIELEPEMGQSPAIADLKAELAIYDRYLDEFGYHMFAVKKNNG